MFAPKLRVGLLVGYIAPFWTSTALDLLELWLIWMELCGCVVVVLFNILV
jgi:hypothetical protein